MGAVYLAERADEQYKKRVAIKLIKRGMDTDSMLRHFRNERQKSSSPSPGRALRARRRLRNPCGSLLAKCSQAQC